LPRLVCISDTHLAEPDLPEGDILIHAGDLTFKGRPEELGRQCNWLKKHVARYKAVLLAPGNHDWGFEKNYSLYKHQYKDAGITVLNDDGVEVEGIKFWGSPITPFFCDWAFNRHPEDIGRHWSLIPDDVQALITHGPPYGILDGVPSHEKTVIGYDKHYRPMYAKKLADVRHVGCPTLLERIKELKQLKLHVFGHVHEGYGQEEHFGVKFVNASIMDEDYRPVNKPIVVDLAG